MTLERQRSERDIAEKSRSRVRESDKDQRETEQRRADLGLGKVTNLLSRSPVPKMKKPASQPEDEIDTD